MVWDCLIKWFVYFGIWNHFIHDKYLQCAGLFDTTIALSFTYELGHVCGNFDEVDVGGAFIGVILLPIVGNAAEHATAVTSAAKGKMETWQFRWL